MIKRIKKSIEIEHKFNLHSHFTLSEYLALHNNEEYDIINCNTLDVHRQSLVSFIDDYFLKKYTQPIDNKLAISYGVDKSYSYFDLFSYVLEMNKLVHHSKIHFIKESGFREFYYALKNFNEVSAYKEGVLFELIYKLHKRIIKYNDIYQVVQEIVHHEAECRKDKVVLIETMTNPIITESKLDERILESKPIRIPQLNNRYNPKLNHPCDEEQNKKSSAILLAHTKLKSTILGYKEKKGLFGKETYLIDKTPFNGLVYGSHCFSDVYLKSLMYQSLFNKKGFIYFNFSATGVEQYVDLFTYTFNVIDEVVYVYHGSKEFYELDLNAMIRNNKIVVIQIPNTDRVNSERLIEGYADFEKLISSINLDISGDYPYSIFVDRPYNYPESFYSSLEKLSDLKSLGYSSIVSMSYIDKDPLLVQSFDYLFMFKCEPSEFLSNLVECNKFTVRDLVSLDRYYFFFYTNGSSDGQLYKCLSFI